MPVRVEAEIPPALVAEIDTIKKVESGTINVEQTNPTLLKGLAYTGWDGSAWTPIRTTSDYRVLLGGTLPLGTSPISNYVLLNAVDPDYTVRYSRCDTTGRLDVTTTTSTVQAQQATSPWVVQTTTSTVQVEQVTSPWIVQTTTSTIQVEQVTSPWITRSDSSSTANVVQATSPWIVQTTTSTIPQVTSIGSTVDVAVVNHAVQTPVDVQAVYYSPVTVFSSTSVSAGSIAVSDWVDVSTFKTVTCSIYSAQASGTLIIEVSPTSSTATAYEYYRDNSISSATFTSKSFTEAFYWVRMSFIASANSTIDGWIGRRTL